ncbi:MAG: DsbA family protein [Coxiellaceae bacterium]|nr:DsbA family protein [Coxiellaceae bacterium]
MKKHLQIAVLSLGMAASALVFAGTTTTTAVTTPATAAAPTFTPAQVDAMHTIIHDYIVANPQILVEASKTLQAQQQKKMEAASMGAIAQNKAKLFDDAQSPSVGEKTAPVTLVEFFDYQCGHCREMAASVEQLISQDKTVRVVFKELPIFGGASNYAAKAALAVAMQPGKYYAFHNALLTSNGPLNKDAIMAIAKKTGVDVAKMTKDMDAPAIEKQLKDNFELAQALKVMGTPTFVIGNKAETTFRFIPGATTLQDLQAQLNAVK